MCVPLIYLRLCNPLFPCDYTESYWLDPVDSWLNPNNLLVQSVRTLHFGDEADRWLVSVQDVMRIFDLC